MIYSPLLALRAALAQRCPLLCEVAILPHVRALPENIKAQPAMRDPNDPTRPYGRALVMPEGHQVKQAGSCVDAVLRANVAIVTRTLCDRRDYVPAMLDNEELVRCAICALHNRGLGPDERVNPLRWVGSIGQVPDFDYVDGLWVSFLGFEWAARFECD